MNRKKSNNSLVKFDSKINEVKQLLKAYARIQEKILNKESNGEKIFSTKNIVGEYAEILCCEKLNLTQEIPSNEAYDATDINNLKVQIKARQLTSKTNNQGERQVGDISLSYLNNLDYIIVILFNSDFSINVAFAIDKEIYKIIAAIVKNNTYYRLTLNNKTIKKLTELSITTKKVLDLKAILEKK